MRTMDEYRDRLLVELARRGYSEKSLKTYKHAFNRLDRSLSVEDLHDPGKVLRFRRRLRKAVGNVDAVLNILRETDEEPRIPELISRNTRPRPHPLWADITRIGATYGNERLSGLTWASVGKCMDLDRGTVLALGRVWAWHMGTDRDPMPQDALVPASGHGKAILEWEVEAIINSATVPDRLQGTIAGHSYEANVEAIAALVEVGASAQVLRDVCVRMGLVGRKDRTMSWDDVDGVIQGVRHTGDPLLLWHWAQRLPVDPKVEPHTLW